MANQPVGADTTTGELPAVVEARIADEIMTTNGLYSGDGLHPNDRAQEQIANDLQTALTSAIRARLESRRLSNLADGNFAIV